MAANSHDNTQTNSSKPSPIRLCVGEDQTIIIADQAFVASSAIFGKVLSSPAYDTKVGLTLPNFDPNDVKLALRILYPPTKTDQVQLSDLNLLNLAEMYILAKQFGLTDFRKETHSAMISEIHRFAELWQAICFARDEDELYNSNGSPRPFLQESNENWVLSATVLIYLLEFEGLPVQPRDRNAEVHDRQEYRGIFEALRKHGWMRNIMGHTEVTAYLTGNGEKAMSLLKYYVNNVDTRR